ncbi:MAG: hypothetical protein ABI354_00010 [Candidatus Saccharimonadales bacterium]
MGETPLYPPPFNPESLPVDPKLSDSEKAADWILSHDMSERRDLERPNTKVEQREPTNLKSIDLRQEKSLLPHEIIDNEEQESYFDRHEILTKDLKSDIPTKKQKPMVSLADVLQQSSTAQQVKSKLTPTDFSKKSKTTNISLFKHLQYRQFIGLGFICGVVIAIVLGVMAYV